MKKDMTAYLQEMIKQNARRRRSAALFLALSMTVSSGVIWTLHDVGVTMANEEETEAHIHSDACYAQKCICELAEDETHTHSEECYESVMICGEDETKTDLPPEISEEDLTEEMFEPPEADEAEAEDTETGEEKTFVLDVPESEAETTEFAARPRALRLPGNEPPQIETIDNIAQGIKITLFDYGDSTLESESNNYNSPKTVSINSGRNKNDDILFFSYGTPRRVGNVLSPDKNSYSGDYNSNPPVSGNRPVQGIVNDVLTDGYPTVSGSNHSLAYLFDPDSGYDSAGVRTTYTGVNHLLKSETVNGVEHLMFDSNENYAYFNQDTNEFEVYNRTFPIRDRENDIFKIGFFPFDAYDTDKNQPQLRSDESAYTAIGYNHHFGMTMEAKFNNVQYDGVNVKEPITFKYSGDDDMWAFIDGVLVMDIGGIHEPAAGMIDFSNGLVWVQDDYNGKDLTNANDLSAVKNALGLDDAEWAAIPKPTAIDTTSPPKAVKWLVNPISDFIENWEDIKYSEHLINVFYLERGASYSNLAIDMNIPTVKPMIVNKEVDYGTHWEDDYDEDTYTFQVYEKVETEEKDEYGENKKVWVIPTDFESRFTLKNGERKLIENIGQSRVFKIVETGVDPNVYSGVEVNDGSTDYESGEHSLNEFNNYTFTNHIEEETTALKVRKKWIDSNNNDVTSTHDDYKVKFKIIRTDTTTGEVSTVAIPVQDGDGTKLKRTFVADKADNWLWTMPIVNGVQQKLPSRYGGHVYTYSVVEQNVPMGYNAAYSTDSNGTKIIANTDKTNVDIYAEKKWPRGGEKEVKLKLKRRSVGYSPSEPTDLLIEVYDEGGNLIASKEIKASDKLVYAEGSVEFTVDMPDGAYYSAATLLQPGTLGFMADNGFFEVSGLAADKNTDGFDNIIQLKVITDNSKDGMLLLHHTFTQSTDGWRAKGNSSIQTSGAVTYAKKDGLRIYNRTAGSDGVMLDLDKKLFKPEKTYSFSAYVYSEAADKFRMVFHDDKNGDKVLASNVNVPANQWTHISGSITLPANTDTSTMYLYIDSGKGSAFRMDEFTAIEGNHTVSVDTNGTVTIQGSNSDPWGKLVYDTKFDRTLPTGWKENNSKLGDTWGQSDFIRLENCGAPYGGIVRDYSNELKPGHQYRFELGSQRDGGSANNVHMNLELGSASYQICDTTLTGNYDWADSSDVVSIPADADMSKVNLYIYTTSTGKSFRLRNLKIYDVTYDGYRYDPNSNSLISDYSNYSLDLDEDSATNPLHKDGEYTEETNWSKEVTLSQTNGWKYHWGKTDLGERTDKLYEYWIEETKIGNATVNAPDAQGRIYSSDGDYLVTYSGNDVATNTADAPIIVTNEYIWYKLPDTGGIGTNGVCAAGILLAVGGLIGGAALDERERRKRMM